jgi:tRNA nucleotidyltransferase (CCA-adding enzyme)
MRTYEINQTIKFNDAIEETLQTIVNNGGTVYIVGGFVRDVYMGNTPNDSDFEVFNMSEMQLANILGCQLTGKSFGVFNVILDGEEVQFSIPRTETKSGSGYNGFSVTLNPMLGIEIAAKRRDFTMNALYIDVQQRNIIIDPFYGISDMKRKVIVPVSEKTFVEDPVRILRAIRFSGQFGFIFDNNLLLLNAIETLLDELIKSPSERFIKELGKLFEKSTTVYGIVYLQYLDCLPMFTFIKQMANQEHCEIYHQEGNVWTHTLNVLQQLIDLKNDEFQIKNYTMWSALFHDWGKVYTSNLKEIIDGKRRITAIGHETKSVELFDKWCDEFAPQFDRVDRNKIKLLIANHMIDTKQIKMLSVKHGKEFAMQLCLLIWADQMGRLPRGTKKAIEMIHLYKWFTENTIVPLVDGTMLIERGYKQNKQFGKWLNTLLKMQIEKTLNKNNIEQSIKIVCGKP